MSKPLPVATLPLPRWTALELRAAFALLRPHITAAVSDSSSIPWTDLAAQLPARTPAMLRALFELNREYLTLPEATASGLCAVVASHYSRLEALASSNGLTSTATTSDTDLDVKMEDVESTPGAANGAIPISGSSDTQREPSYSSSAAMDVAVSTHKQVDGLASTPAAVATAFDSAPSVLSAAPSVLVQDKRRKLNHALAWSATGVTGQLERRAQLQLQIQSDDSDGSNEASAAATALGASGSLRAVAIGAKTSQRKSAKPRRTRAWVTSPLLARQLRGNRFALPWTHWFCSCADSAFFRENEFVACLHRMGLAKITAAARPVWASVRASMGRPRRLSARFFALETTKLERFRAVARTSSGIQTPESMTSLPVGAKVLVRLDTCETEFAMATVRSCSLSDSTCTVQLTGSDRELTCCLSAVMALDSHTLACSSEDTAAPEMRLREQQTAPSVLQSTRCALAPVVAAAESSTQQRHVTIAAVLAVRDLLQRKEQLVAALSAMNASVAGGQRSVAPAPAAATPMFGASNVTSVVNGAQSLPALTTRTGQSELQRQYAWVLANLEATNRSLQDALVQLQQSSQASSTLLGPGHTALSSLVHSQAPAQMLQHGEDAPSESLSLRDMKWAVRFLAQSRSKASEFVDTQAAAMRMDLDAHRDEQPQLQPRDAAVVLPDTRELIATCLCLMSVVRRGASATPSVPLLVTQKLSERLLELLEPRHDSNMDLYAELRAAAEGVLATLQP